MAVVVAALALAAPAHAAPGQLDPSFGSAGAAAIDFPVGATAADLVQQPDGKLVAAGMAGLSGFALARYDTSGILDTSFGDGGLVATPVGSPIDGGPVAALQPDGKIVVAGTAAASPGTFAVLRYLPDGSLDPSFGTSGEVTTDVGQSASVDHVGVQPDGTILVSGTADQVDTFARYAADGLLDPSFGSGGIARGSSGLPAAGDAGSAAIQPGASELASIAKRFASAFIAENARPLALAVERGQRIVAAGSSSVAGVAEATLAQLNRDGSLASSFGEGGRALRPFGAGAASATVEAATAQRDGKVIVAGTTAPAGSAPSGFALARYTADGSIDSSFGAGSLVETGFAGAARAIAVATQPNGAIVAAGTVSRGARTDVAVARYMPDGTPDRSFGGGGTVVLPRRDVGRPAPGLAIERGGRIVIAGSRGGFRLAGLEADGRLDRSFGRGGRVHTRLGRQSVAEGVLTGGRRVVVYGESGGRIALARYRADGSPDPSFGRRGTVVSGIPAFAPGTERATIQPDGEIVIAGSVRGRFAVARFNSDGSVDRSFGRRGRAISTVRGAATAVAAAPGDGILVAGSRGTASDARFVVARFNGAEVKRRVAKRAAKPRQPRPRRLGPPNPVPAWYVNASNVQELKQFAAQDACAFARTQPKTAKRTLILDFGGARVYPDGSFGAAVNNATFEATNQQIRLALNTAADAYAACHRQGRVTIAYANTNHFNLQSVAVRARQIGVRQASTAARLSGYLHQAGYAPAIRAGVAGDIETGYWGSSQSKAMVNGAKSVRRHGYMDFGTAGGCPPYLKGQRRPRHHKCLNDWTLDDVAHVSNAGGGEPLPEIYYRGGRYHYDQAAQWARVARRWNSKHATPFSFFGATGSTEFSNLTPGQSWKRLTRQTTGHVGRELVNFKQDHFKPVPAAARRDAQPS